MSEMLNAALGYAELGLGNGVCPLKPGTKIPYTENGHLDATFDATQLNAWWTATERANVGNALSEDELELDIESVEGHEVDGFATFHELEEHLGELPRTFTVRTATNGEHRRFKLPTDVVGKPLRRYLGKGVELKSKGQVVMPPSVINGKRYTVKDASDIAELPPEWLVECLKPEIEWTNRRLVTSDRSTLCEKYKISMFDVCDVPGTAHQNGNDIIFAHPTHGSVTGHNFAVKSDGSSFFCFRHWVGGDPLIWLAIREGLIKCEDAGPLDVETFRLCRKIAERDGLIQDKSDRAGITVDKQSWAVRRGDAL